MKKKAILVLNSFSNSINTLKWGHLWNRDTCGLSQGCPYFTGFKVKMYLPISLLKFLLEWLSQWLNPVVTNVHCPWQAKVKVIHPLKVQGSKTNEQLIDERFQPLVWWYCTKDNDRDPLASDTLNTFGYCLRPQKLMFSVDSHTVLTPSNQLSLLF
jgi:hypothetical protein